VGRKPGKYGTLLEQAEVNVRRELDNLVTQMHSSGVRYDDAVREFKRQYLREVLVAHRGNQCKAAEELGMHRNTLSRTMADLGLSLAEVRAGLKRPPRSERPVYSAVRQSLSPRLERFQVDCLQSRLRPVLSHPFRS
jgi:Fis family transcriptional regulator